MPSIFQSDLSSGCLPDLIAVHGEDVRLFEASGATRNITAIVELFSDLIEYKGPKKYRVQLARVVGTRSYTEGLGNPQPGQAVRFSTDAADDRWTWKESERMGTAAIVAIYRKSTLLASGDRQPQ